MSIEVRSLRSVSDASSIFSTSISFSTVVRQARNNPTGTATTMMWKTMETTLPSMISRSRNSPCKRT